MSTAFQKPENALKRAEELVSVGQQQEALNVLHNTISHRRMRAVGWDQSVEILMMRHIALCVELQKLKTVREGLHFYRVITHQHNVLALAKAMKELRDLSEGRLAAAKAKLTAAAVAAPDVEDLEAEETPESLMLSTLQVEVRDKKAEELHIGLLGCWESYKIIMDLLRFAPKIDYLYHETAQKALEFCRANKRLQEFRRLCDTLRVHYVNFQKHKGKPDFEALTRPEAHLSTRLKQLDVGADLGLFSICFQTAEDILSLGLYEILQKSLNERNSLLHKHRSLLLSQTALLYEKLAMIFRVGEQPVFHASAILRHLFHVRTHKKNVSLETQTALCDLGTLTVLCVPITEKPNLTPAELEDQRRFASMLGHGGIPTRRSMKQVIEAHGVVASASGPVQALFNLMENEVDPLRLCKDCMVQIEKLEADERLAGYVPSLKLCIFDKLLLKAAKIYTSVYINFFTTVLCPPEFLTWTEVEMRLVQLRAQGVSVSEAGGEGAGALAQQIRIDHSRQALLFGGSGGALEAGSTADGSQPQQVDCASLLQGRLAQMARQLADVVPKLEIPIRTSKHPDASTVLLGIEEARAAFYASLSGALEAERARLKARNKRVAERRQRQEAEEQAKEAARLSREREKQKKEEQEEQTRREAARRKQEELRRKEERQSAKLELSQSLVADFKAIAEKAPTKIVIKGKNLEDITPADIMSRVFTYEDYEKAQQELRQREKTEKGRMRRNEIKRVEHLVRALRAEESPLLDAWCKEVAEADAQICADFAARLERERRRAFEESTQLRDVMSKIAHVRDKWYAARMEERSAAYERACEARQQRIVAKLKAAKIERARQRRAEAEEQLRIEEEQRQREAEERQRKEAARRKEEELRRATEMQRLAEERAEKRLEEERAAAAAAAAGPTITRGPPRERPTVDPVRAAPAAASAPVADLDWGSVRSAKPPSAARRPVARPEPEAPRRSRPPAASAASPADGTSTSWRTGPRGPPPAASVSEQPPQLAPLSVQPKADGSKPLLSRLARRRAEAAAERQRRGDGNAPGGPPLAGVRVKD